MGPEAETQKLILDYLTMRGIYHYRNNTGRRGGVSYGKVGSADILGILPNGRFLAIEVKRSGGVASFEQLEFLANIAKNGGVAFVADNLQTVIDHLSKAGF